MNLDELINILEEKQIIGNLDVMVNDVTCDSRQVRDGALFVCIRGYKLDGHDYAAHAVANGAKAIVAERKLPGIPVPQIIVDNSRVALARLASHFWGHPSEKLKLIGVTGTNGKTTTTYLVETIMAKAGYKTGLIGTIKNKIGDRFYEVKNTTPESAELQRMLHQMVELGTDYVAMEVSSHALELSRVTGCNFAVGVFTNITQDHLDFHVNFANYVSAKTKLFTSMGTDQKRFAVINIDDPNSDYIMARTKVNIITYGIEKPATVTAQEIAVTANGVAFTAVTPQGKEKFKLKLTGLFNVYNALAAICVGLTQGVNLALIKEALESVPGVPGRFELIDCGQDFTVIVDYAHTPDGLENILKTAKAFAQRRIITVFGCGGDRDRTKRPLMGKVAAKYADYCIITSDNPRSEDPVQIIKETEAGVVEGGKSRDDYATVTDRRQAIAKAIAMAEPGDVVIIAGKGHETYQIIKDKVLPFDDREVAREILRSRNG